MIENDEIIGTIDAIEHSSSDASGSVKQNAKDTVSNLKAAAESAKVTATVAAAQARETGGQIKAQASGLAGQATESARAAAEVAKGRTGEALHGLAKLIAETAETVETKLGPQYGDYARLAAERVTGAARTLDDKEVDDLVDDAREFVRKSPAVVIGAAAVAGFVLMRLARGGSKED